MTIVMDFVLPYAALIATCWFTYAWIIKGGWVSDDVLGMAVYDGKMQRPLHDWGNVLKKFRYEFGKTINPEAGKLIDEKDPSKGQKPDYVSDNKAHHRLNLHLLCGISALLYHYLTPIVGANVAFIATMLFIVHPVGVQAVGWISGIGYVMGFFFALLGLNLAQAAYAYGWVNDPMGMVLTLAGFAFFQFIAVQAMYSTIGAMFILALFHQWPFAIVAFLISLFGFAQTLMSAVNLRKNAFKEQDMGASTRFHARKFIVALKSLLYFVQLSVFPKSLGLYHIYGYHYTLPKVEWETKDFWCGLGLVATGLVTFFVAPIPIQLALVWFLGFLLIFLNFITINQFVTERYVWMPTVGTCLIAAYLTQNHPWIAAVLFGMAIVRTWMHFPTYYDEVRFYQSNIWNFPKSEVAFGNLGVVYLNNQLVGSAIEMWKIGAKLNPDYDVNWYNLSQVHKNEGVRQNSRPLLEEALGYLKNAVKCKVCHMRERWHKEMVELEALIAGGNYQVGADKKTLDRVGLTRISFDLPKAVGT